MTEDLIKTSIRFCISSIIVNTNSLEMTTEEKDAVLNNAFNGLINSLIPEYALYALDVIMGYSNTYKAIENDNLAKSIGWS